MAAPTSTWSFAYDLWGNRTPRVVSLEAAGSLETLEGTLIYMNGGLATAAGASASTLIGIAAEATSAALSASDPIKVALIAPGMVIKGTADADSSTLSGFNGKTSDLNSNQTMDFADTTNGCLSVYLTENSGLTVYCTITEFDAGPVN